jgi:hypothetical protein
LDQIIQWLLTNPEWLSVQGLFQNYGGLLSIIGAAAYWHASCDAHKWCWRPGRMPVRGTTWRVCGNHHTREHHDRLFHLHKIKHPSRHRV